VGMHNSIPEYMSTASILKPFEKKFFEEVIFSSNIIKTPHQTEQKKGGRERKAQRVSSNKVEVNILIGEKHFNFKNHF
jgi:hypothetical protein